MVPVSSLVVPILVAAVIVFIASSIIHMVLPFHRKDVRRLEKEDEVLEAFRRLGVAPGDYLAPHAGSHEGMKNPAFIEKMKTGPWVIMTVAPGGDAGLGKSLSLWFLYSVVVGVFAAYLAGRALGPGAHYLAVFRFAGTAAFMGYSLALLQQAIWWKRSWATTFKGVADGLVYGLLTGGTFGWLWPN